MGISDSTSPDDLGRAFHESLLDLLPIRNGSDRTCFRNITKWLVREVGAGRLKRTAFQDALIFAREASTPGVRNPNAVFVSILKKELHYDPKSR